MRLGRSSTRRVVTRPSALFRASCAGGVLGPAIFVASWATLGFVRDDYSPVTGFVSDLARDDGGGTSGAMTAGFVGFSAGILAFAPALARLTNRRASVAAAGCAVGTLGVAAFPLGSTTDRLHALSAGVAYVGLALSPLLASYAMGSRRWRRASVVIGAASAASLLASAAPSNPAGGLFQRVGFTVVDVWFVAVAASAIVGRPPR